MPWLYLPYQKFDIAPSPAFPEGTTAWRPNLFATLIASNGNTFTCMVCADTGADQCVFPLSFALALGLDPLKMHQCATSGVGSSGNVTYYDTLTIDFGSGIKFPAYVGFTLALEDQGIGLLGQQGFFDRFNTIFSYKDKRFWIEVP